MTEKRSPAGEHSDRPGSSVGNDLKEKRDAFLHTFFKRGAELTDELLRDNVRPRDQVTLLEDENTSLKTQLASDRAIRDLLYTIEELEREKSRLLSTVHAQEEMTGRISGRFAEIESELESFANLYVASFQLHVSLKAPVVMRHVRELLMQLVGARAVAVYFVEPDGRRLTAIASDGIDLSNVPTVPLHDTAATDPVLTVIERTFLTGVPHVAEGAITSTPAACIPLQVEDKPVGAIVVYGLLEQKKRFVTVDHELFKLLGAHAGARIVAAYQYANGEGKLPTPDALRALSA